MIIWIIGILVAPLFLEKRIQSNHGMYLLHLYQMLYLLELLTHLWNCCIHRMVLFRLILFNVRILNHHCLCWFVFEKLIISRILCDTYINYYEVINHWKLFSFLKFQQFFFMINTTIISLHLLSMMPQSSLIQKNLFKKYSHFIDK